MVFMPPIQNSGGQGKNLGQVSRAEIANTLASLKNLIEKEQNFPPAIPAKPGGMVHAPEKTTRFGNARKQRQLQELKSSVEPLFPRLLELAQERDIDLPPESFELMAAYEILASKGECSKMAEKCSALADALLREDKSAPVRTIGLFALFDSAVFLLRAEKLEEACGKLRAALYYSEEIKGMEHMSEEASLLLHDVLLVLEKYDEARKYVSMAARIRNAEADLLEFTERALSLIKNGGKNPE